MDHLLSKIFKEDYAVRQDLTLKKVSLREDTANLLAYNSWLLL